MSEQQRVVIVGAGMAGVQTAVALRDQGFTGTVTLIGEEPHQPYDRPPLSKAVLLGKAEGSAFDIDFGALGVELLLGCEVFGVRPGDRELDTSRGPVPYDSLVVATGAHPVALPGSEGVPGVHLLRTLDDAEGLRTVLADRSDVVVVGAGWIGAEFATAAREAGCAVTVVEAADRPLAGVLPAEVAAPMADWYADSGAELVTGARVARVEPGAVVLADGRRLPAGAVLVGIGARPATGWLAGSGIELGADGSVTADDRLRTSLPDVYAVGDCASFPSRRFGERLLVHHWDNALQGAAYGRGGRDRRDAAELRPGAVLLVRAVRPLRPVRGPPRVRRHDGPARRSRPGPGARPGGAPPAGPAWSVCWLRAGRLVAVLAVGRPRDLAQGRKLIESGVPLDPARVADPAVALKSAVLPSS